jgi:hypothetical protein
MAKFSGSVTTSVFFRKSGPAASWYDRLARWLLGDFGGNRPGPENDWTQVFKNILATLRSCMRSTKRAMGQNWGSVRPDDFTRLR